MKEHGTVKLFNCEKGYGFIQRDEGGDVFVHYKAIQTDGYKSLSKGDRVAFNVVKVQKGNQAEEVSLI